MSAKPSLLLLSSGARPRYLEDIVRALALPSGGHIQFRYEDTLLAAGVKSYFKDRKENTLVGQTCYLAYLDNRTPGKKPEIVPVREAVVLEVNERGSSFIFRMEVARYIRTKELAQLRSFIESSVQEPLPTWKPDYEKYPKHPFDGYWVNLLRFPLSEDELAHHDPVEGKHLGLFEDAVKTLCLHSEDFGDPSRRLFFNVIGLKDSSGENRFLVDGDWTLLPGHKYRLDIYHFYPEEGTHAPRPMHWLSCRASGQGLSVLGGGILRADSEYDLKKIDLQTTGSTRESQNALTIFTTMEPSNEAAVRADLLFNVKVEADLVRNAVQAIVIGLFVSLPGLIAIYPDVPSWKSLMILVGGLLAGLASVFKFSRSA